MPKSAMPTHHNRRALNIYSDIERTILSKLDGIHLMDMYIWNRPNPAKKLMFGSYPYPMNLYAQNTAEFTGVFVKEGRTDKPDPEAKARSALSQEEWVRYAKQVWNIPAPSQADAGWGKHAALMPEEIARRCIKMFSLAGDCVLGPFAGPGTTLRVALELKQDFVGYEIYPS